MNVTSVGATENGAGLSSGKTLASNFNGFLKLLTTQLANQDPLSPMDTDQFTTQLVQFAAVEQSIKTNDQLAQLNKLVGADRMTSALDYLGNEVSAVADRVRVPASGEGVIRYGLPAEAAGVNVTVRDARGAVVHSAPGPTGAGTHEVRWNGKTSGGSRLPPGDYRVSVEATDGAGRPITVDRTITGRVTAVENGERGLELLVGGVPVPVSTVKEIRPAPPAPPPAV